MLFWINVSYRIECSTTEWWKWNYALFFFVLFCCFFRSLSGWLIRNLDACLNITYNNTNVTSANFRGSLLFEMKKKTIASDSNTYFWIHFRCEYFFSSNFTNSIALNNFKIQMILFSLSFTVTKNALWHEFWFPFDNNFHKNGENLNALLLFNDFISVSKKNGEAVGYRLWKEKHRLTNN